MRVGEPRATTFGRFLIGLVKIDVLVVSEAALDRHTLKDTVTCDDKVIVWYRTPICACNEGLRLGLRPPSEVSHLTYDGSEFYVPSGSYLYYGP